MSDPLLVDELENEELRQQFNNLMEAILFNRRDREMYEALNERVHQEVTNEPILARIVDDDEGSLLYAACSYLNLDTSSRVIKLLIQAYPSALTVDVNGGYTNMPIYMIAEHSEHCVLMPWISANYPWALDHERCPPVVFGLLRMYLQRTSCTATTIKQVFEAYPRAFTQQDPDDGNILHKILDPAYHHDECEVDLLKWMVKRCPSSYLLEKDSNGRTPLYLACNLLLSVEDNVRDWSEICKYLVHMCPDAVRMFNKDDDDYGNNDILPIHILQDSCGNGFVREVVVCLLREYPESYDMPARPYARRTSPSSIPFIQIIKPYLDEEKELRETAVSLTYTTSSLTKAVTCINDKLTRSSSTVYDSWANSFVNTTEDKINSISMKLQEMCDEGIKLDE